MRLPLRTLRYTLLYVFSTIFCFPITAQDAPIKYGKIDIADLQMKVYPKDTSAEAVVLGDVGRAYFEYSQNDGFQIVYERHRRVKILKKSGYDWATVKVGLYVSKNNNGKEELYDLKGVTYNLENGQIVKDKLEKESIFTDKTDDNHSVKRFAFSKVKEGSIIEYSYRIKSDFYYNFRDWTFQSSIPVAWSEFSVSVPEYFTYRQIQQGYEPMLINEAKNGQTSYTLHVPGTFSGTSTIRSAATSETVNVITKDFRWAMKDLPSIREEPFMTTIDDYVSKIEFELSSSFFPGGGYKSYANSWESINTRLLENEFFGQQLNRSGYLKDMVSVIKASSKDTLQQIGMAYNLIKQAMTWNERETFYAESTLKKAFDAKTGNAADINLLLVVLLRELGYDANPVILSTRDNGRVLDNYVLLSKFNYVIAHVDMGGKELLLDATAIQTPAGILPIRCLNGQGRLISKNGTRWVDLQSSYKNAETTIGNFELNADGTGKGELAITHLGYNNVRERRKFVKEGKEKYIEEYKKKATNWQIAKTELENTDDASSPFVRKHDLTVNELATVAGERIYFNPVMYNPQKENPFKNPERKFPVDFGALIEETFIATYTIPQGYTVEEMPKSARIGLPEDGGKFTYIVGVPEEGKISISSKVALKKTMYFAEEYDTLRKFYDQIVQKHAEQIVLKKK
jgi:Domain of Unknown Function with PDB structure (DUF3857)